MSTNDNIEAHLLWEHTPDTGATFSECRFYRYALWRWWDKSKPYLMVIGLNPSTADETEDDPTIRRCKRFAADWGYGGLYMTNLFAIRATDPKVMRAHSSPVGDRNDYYLAHFGISAGLVLAAWGAHGNHNGRDKEVMRLFKSFPAMKCLGTTNSGQPRHPLYIKADTKPVHF